ncbi:MAG TPA: cytochrome C [Geobacteraceae bacterium]
MKNARIPLLSFLLFLSSGCAMFTAWKTIPPPGGCDQCHTVPISANWQVTYKAPVLSDERDKLYFQTEQATMPQAGKPASSLDLRKVQEQPCFECHRSPNAKHAGRSGHYHH